MCEKQSRWISNLNAHVNVSNFFMGNYLGNYFGCILSGNMQEVHHVLRQSSLHLVRANNSGLDT